MVLKISELREGMLVYPTPKCGCLDINGALQVRVGGKGGDEFFVYCKEGEHFICDHDGDGISREFDKYERSP